MGNWHTVSLLIMSVCSLSARQGSPVRFAVLPKGEVHTALQIHPARTKYQWLQTDSTLALQRQGIVFWQFNFSKRSDKPYFHPLRPVVGPVLTWLRPADHPWHRGLWFTWKLINGVNYWEEDPKTGLSEGRSRINRVRAVPHPDYSATITLDLTYVPAGKSAVLTEHRLITVSAPDPEGAYRIDWKQDFTVGDQPVDLDRTPPQQLGGPAYGGYAGLSYRAAPTLHGHRYLDSNGSTSTAEQVGIGQPARWMDLSANADSTGREAWGGIAMFNHPKNPVSPTPWYVYKDKQFVFFNAALLFNQAIRWPARHHQTLRYRVLVHNKMGRQAYLDRCYTAFLTMNP